MKRAISQQRQSAYLATSALLLAVALEATPARADFACPNVQDQNHTLIHLDHYVASSRPVYYFGNFSLFGTSVVGACVEDATHPAGKLYAVLDSHDNLLGWLPTIWSMLCLPETSDDFRVLTRNENHCGTPMTPLNYAGNQLQVSGLGGSDHMDGGNGTDIFYGGAGDDNLSDDSQTPGNDPRYFAYLYGESGRDLIFGSSGNQTFMNGGSGNDGITDSGGTGDTVNGDVGVECCMYDSNEPGAIFCDSRSDVVQSTAGTHNCKATNPDCNVSMFMCF